MRIIRYPSITEPQFFGCVSALVDSLFGELNAAAAALRRLSGTSKGGAFAYEMTLDTHRYGALIVLDRWSTLAGAFGPHLRLSRRPAILADAAEEYASTMVEAAILAFQALQVTFGQEARAAEAFAKLGPMLPEEYKDARRIFLEDLAAR